MTENTPPNPPEQELLAVAQAICKSGKFETGEGTCSLLCMEFLGDPRKAGCAHAVKVHGDLSNQIIAARTPIPSLSDEGAREQFKARMDSLVSMAEASPFHDESSRRAARAMRDFAVSSFNELAASRSTDLPKVVEALTGADQYLVWGMDSAQTSLERKGAMVDALTFVRQALASINAEGSAMSHPAPSRCVGECEL